MKASFCILIEARAELEGGPEKYVKSGSTLKLTCHIRQSSVAPDFVFWYHDGRMINYEGALGVSVQGDATSSTLIVGKAHSLHSGNYSCVPSNVRPASVLVHILHGTWFNERGTHIVSLLNMIPYMVGHDTLLTVTTASIPFTVIFLAKLRNYLLFICLGYHCYI